MSSIDIRYLYSRQQTLLGSWMGWKYELRDVLRHFDPGSRFRLRPVVDSVFPLRDAAAAHRRMEDRTNFGKIVLSI